jgi:hypothetical protein
VDKSPEKIHGRFLPEGPESAQTPQAAHAQHASKNTGQPATVRDFFIACGDRAAAAIHPLRL